MITGWLVYNVSTNILHFTVNYSEFQQMVDPIGQMVVGKWPWAFGSGHLAWGSNTLQICSPGIVFHATARPSTCTSHLAGETINLKTSKPTRTAYDTGWTEPIKSLWANEFVCRKNSIGHQSAVCLQNTFSYLPKWDFSDGHFWHQNY